MGGHQSADNPQAADTSVGRLPGVPDELVHYMEDAKQTLERDESVIPCELCGTFHSNCSGSMRGFCSSAHKREWFDAHIQTLREVKSNIMENWEELDADFVMKHAGVAGAALPPYRHMHTRVRTRLQEQVKYYKDIFDRLPDEEKQKVLDLDEMWPPSSEKELKDRCIQPEEAMTMKLNYAAGVDRYQALWIFSSALARSMGIDPNQGVERSVKRPQRLLKKAICGYPEEYAHNDFRKSIDVYRTSVIADEMEQIAQMTALLECLGRTTFDRKAPMKLLGLEASRDHYVVERIKNRFLQPAIGGYMDMVVNLRINGYVCEVQIHWRPLYDSMGEDGRRLAKWFRHFPADGDGYEEVEEVVMPDTNGRGMVTIGLKTSRSEHHGGQYMGDMEDGKRHGTGTLYYHSGDRYQGEFHQGAKHGLGTYYYASGDRYRGSFWNDRMHGKGKYFCFNGELYEGEFKEGMRQGTGVYHYADGTTYEGDWWRNKRVSQEIV